MGELKAEAIASSRQLPRFPNLKRLKPCEIRILAKVAQGLTQTRPMPQAYPGLLAWLLLGQLSIRQLRGSCFTGQLRG